MRERENPCFIQLLPEAEPEVSKICNSTKVNHESVLRGAVGSLTGKCCSVSVHVLIALES